jgi:hypothetical protein
MASTGGRLGWLCDQPMSIFGGYIQSVLVDTDYAKRDKMVAHLEGKKVVHAEDGSYTIVDPDEVMSQMAALGIVLPEGIEVPDWFVFDPGVSASEQAQSVSLDSLNANPGS